MSKLTAVAAAFLVFVPACGRTEGRPSAAAPTAVRLMATPPDALRKCRSAPVLRRACPSEVPAALYDARSEIYDARVFAPGRGNARTFNLQWGGETPGRPERNRPPRMVHVVLVGGEFESPFPVDGAAAPRDGLMRTARRTGIDLGPARWNGRDGRLVLAPPYPRGGIDGNHLLFRWREAGGLYQLGLHAWEPFTETVATLRAMVASLPPR
jgi:hypothetical protein